MPEIISPENLELEEIEELERQLAERKAAREKKEAGIIETDKEAEITKENLQEVQSQISSTTQTAPVKNEEERKRKIAKDISALRDMDEVRKIETLVMIALSEGIDHSIEVARGLQDPYILDSLHDKLIGELHDKLIKEGKLKDL
ncbi:MAG: hypothetical protein PHI66_00970 [Candidatus Pacebacteria bacterium]|nr:hypothetical protein [Candidatus Paceibacterota bacterium]